jgi:curli biogenesis system outer membrane secretion channel CsgG
VLPQGGASPEPSQVVTAAAQTTSASAQTIGVGACTDPGATAPARGASDVGSIRQITCQIEGIGSTPELAVLSALQSAVAQVNGVRVASRLQGLRMGLDVDVNGAHAVSVDMSAFAQRAVLASQGAVTGYQVLSQQEISRLDDETIASVRASDAGYHYASSATAGAAGNGAAATAANGNTDRGASSYSSDVTSRKIQSYWKVAIRATVAKYAAPDESGRPKIVIASPRTRQASYVVGDTRVPAAEVSRAVQARLSDMLTQTRRFIVLDRQFGNELSNEFDLIASGATRVQDGARLGEMLATDLILVPVIERFEYPRETRRLRMSDRELVSYSGGGRVALRLLNATTGEVVMSDTFEYTLPATAASTLPRVIDGNSMTTTMMKALADQMGSAVVSEIFPIAVVAMNGDQVVLSQGGDQLQSGQRWQAITLGKELTDPQTGRSLGRNESPCCTVRIDRVGAQTSYGTIEQGASAVDSAFVSGAIVLRGKAVTNAAAAKNP